MRYRIWLFLMAGALSLSLTSRIEAETQTKAGGLLDSEDATYRRLRDEGYDALYNMEYTTARERFETLRRDCPLHPAPPFYLATTQWIQLLNAKRRLQTGLYAGQSFFAEGEDKPDPRFDQEFRQLVNTALTLAKEAEARNPRDLTALYYEGSAHGLLASYEATVTRSFFSALRNGLKSVELDRRIVEADPNFRDAYLTIGAYDYIVGSLPFFVKILATIGGFHGSQERGLATLEKVANEGRDARDEARILLLTFYSREKRWTDCLRIVEEMARRYPRNFLFRLEQANLLDRLNRTSQSRDLFEALLQDPAMQKSTDLIHFQYAEALAGHGKFAEALNQYRASAGAAGAAAEMVTRARLRAGQMLDRLGRRSEAVAEYREVLNRPNVFDSHEQARKYLKEPYRGED
jgi:tetratricopeptide (TPR) repeat protein